MRTGESMTLAQVEAIDREYLLPREVAAVLGTTDQGIRTWARQRPEELGFPVICIGSRVKIPKEGFLNYMKGGVSRGVVVDYSERCDVYLAGHNANPRRRIRP